MSSVARSLVLGVLLLAPRAGAEDARTERSQVEQRIATERAALNLLQAQKGSTLAVLDAYERLARGAAARTEALATQLRLLRGRLARAEAQEALTRAVLRVRVEQLGPRLFTLYRLMQRSPLEVLLPSSDVAAMAWRARAVSTVVRGDLGALEETRAVAAFQRQSLAELDRLKATLGDRLDALRDEAAESSAQKADLTDALALLQAKAKHGSAVLADLARAQAHLDAVIAQLDQIPETSGFGALRGKLELPVRAGRIEVAFGKVVNPRFNTITVQKGLDIRAPPGTPVRAVAPGVVAWAGWLRGYGNVVVVDHGAGYHTLVAHLAESMRAVGARLSEGEVLGTVGDTGSLKGPYLYFEIRQRGLAVDPAGWLAAATFTRAAIGLP